MAEHVGRTAGELAAMAAVFGSGSTFLLKMAVAALVMSLTGMAIKNTALERAGQCSGVVIFLVATFKLVFQG